MIYLASRSPQRCSLLKSKGIPYRVIHSHYRERNLPGLTPGRLAVMHACGKASSVKLKKGIVLGADTVVSFRGRIFGKPRNKKEAYRMLKMFSGGTQSIYTGVALRDTAVGKIRSFLVKSTVTFHRITEDDILDYLASGEYRGKAGSFGLQGKGSHLIRSTRGSRSNIIGLPMERLGRELRAFCQKR